MSIIATNKVAFHDYEIVKKLSAGIQLAGHEVKSAKKTRVQLKDSFVKISKEGEVYLYNCYIAPYAMAPIKEYQPYRARKLLLHANEISQLQAYAKGQNLTIVPLKLYTTSRGLIKVEIGMGKGRRQYEKRKIKKERETKREIERTLKKYQ